MKFNNPLIRIPHLEDLLFLEGYEGFRKIIKTISQISNYLSGHPTENFHINQKYDGSPSIVFGRHGERYFVSTKSIFNKIPKINYTFSDVLRNHSNSSTLLVAKLGEVLDRLPDLLLLPNQIFQGDLIYTLGDKQNNKFSSWHFIPQPNLLKYRFKYSESKDIGISVHTKYILSNDAYHQSSFVNHFDLTEMPEMLDSKNRIHIINPSHIHTPEKDKTRYSKAVSRVEFIERYYIKDLIELVNKFTPGALNSITKCYGEQLIKYNNQCVRENRALFANDLPSTIEYSEPIVNLIMLFNSIAMVKEIMIGDLLARGRFPHEYDTPEGFVITHDWTEYPIKLVNRRDFTYKNHLFHSNK